MCIRMAGALPSQLMGTVRPKPTPVPGSGDMSRRPKYHWGCMVPRGSPKGRRAKSPKPHLPANLPRTATSPPGWGTAGSPLSSSSVPAALTASVPVAMVKWWKREAAPAGAVPLPTAAASWPQRAASDKGRMASCRFTSYDHQGELLFNPLGLSALTSGSRHPYNH